MRSIRKLDEVAAISAVSRVLKESGAQVVDDPAFTDKPDWVFELDGVRVAAECICINLEKLMEWNNSRRRLQQEKCYEIIFPVEPHLWIKKAIEAKVDKVAEYTLRSKSKEAWLIAHSDLDQGLPLFECNENMLRTMRDAAASLNSKFERIWFIHREFGAHQIWRKGEPVVPFPEIDLTNGYPISNQKQLLATITKDGLNVSVGPENTIESIRLQPLDKRYQINY